MSYEQVDIKHCDGKGLCNLDYVEQYAEILQNQLPKKFSRFGSFFAGTQRLRTLASVLQRYIKGHGLDVLNVGCGPFATELFVESLQFQKIQSLDYTPEFAPIHQILQEEGYIKNTSFQQGDAKAIEFPESSFDLMIIHDVFFEEALEMNSLILRLRPFLKPDGYIYFDFINSRTHWIWRLLGKRDQFRRYDPASVKEFLNKAGFKIIAFQPTHGASALSVRFLHWALWTFFRASNNYSVLIQGKNV
ncbi:class I SAM-dependent methyltransferase [Sneathiella litorea]|uniref:Methyltransferase domain-containing protein n=1 Tax=Sneathiella litorea TaxID=2606216 RepID=A0A6L8WCH5_9PROT|nr:class I SAM-dependent methyltransferase [Sneathiella litorea]MZR32399.1 methyltransferase domain-containing protein [Sneathiella litorea]